MLSSKLTFLSIPMKEDILQPLFELLSLLMTMEDKDGKVDE
jgi:hypothetical protein